MGRIRVLAGVISLSAGLLFSTANLAVAAQPAPELVLIVEYQIPAVIVCNPLI